MYIYNWHCQGRTLLVLYIKETFFNCPRSLFFLSLGYVSYPLSLSLSISLCMFWLFCCCLSILFCYDSVRVQKMANHRLVFLLWLFRSLRRLGAFADESNFLELPRMLSSE